MASRRSQRLLGRREVRKETNRFFNSIADLRRAHKRLFENKLHASISRRYVGSTGYGLMTCSVRLQAGSDQDAVQLRPFVRRALAYLIDQFDSVSPYQVRLHYLH